jgi:Flp pilus assembly pilin Flp
MIRRIARGFRHLWRDDRGQDLAEYGIALSVISVSIALIAIFIGIVSRDLWDTAEARIGTAIGGS